jgi:radical SAM superfamily enzyme YgiQ (UPF0313 family)
MAFNVVLVNPPSVNGLVLPMDARKVKRHGHKPPLGLLYLGAALGALPDVNTFLLDCQLENLGAEEAVRRVSALKPDLVGMSAWTDFWFDISRMLSGLKQALPGCCICLGGPHTGIFGRESLARPEVDAIVVGDGEAPLVHLVKLLTGQASGGHPGLYVKADLGRPEPFQAYAELNLDALAQPNRELLPYKRYNSLVANGPVTSMVTSRGCPHRCSFCKLDFQKTVLRSAENVVREMADIAKLGVREIEIYDDTFGTSRKRVLEICRLMRQTDLDFSLSIRDRVSNIDAEVLAALKSVGLKRVSLGVESASDATLRRIGKGITVEQARRAVAAAKKLGLEVLAYFMIGLPGETAADFERTLALAVEMDPDYANFSVTIPYPGTALYREALERGLFDRDIWREFVLDPQPDMVMPVYTAECSRQELLDLQPKILRRFYFRPRYVLKRLSGIGNLGQLARNASMAWEMLRG